MGTRTSELRNRERRVLYWSLFIAAALHVVVFLLWPTMHVEPLPQADVQGQAGSSPQGASVYVDVLFGPPEIFEEDGSISREPPDRVLQADRILSLNTGCETLAHRDKIPAHGSVRLWVRASGDADVQGLSKSTGDECADQVMTAVADALRYHWLPSERFPAPVDLIQPITLFEARD